MKKLLIGILVLGSVSSFAQDRIKVKEKSIQSIDVSSECVPDQVHGRIGYKDLMFSLKLKIQNEVFIKSYRSEGDHNENCLLASEKENKELLKNLRDLQDTDDGSIQVLQSKDSLVCYKDVLTLLVKKNTEEENKIEEIISSYTVVPCP